MTMACASILISCVMEMMTVVTTVMNAIVQVIQFVVPVVIDLLLMKELLMSSSSKFVDPGQQI